MQLCNKTCNTHFKCTFKKTLFETTCDVLNYRKYANGSYKMIVLLFVATRHVQCLCFEILIIGNFILVNT